MTKRLLILCLCLTLISPPLALAQNSLEPGQDPFALSDELLRFFGAEPQNSDPTDDNSSLFNGDDMVNNGLFSTPNTQLGGASPLTNPIRTNQDDIGPTMIMLTSAYEPAGDLTSQSVIKVTITAKNVGDNLARDLTLRATLQDSNADLLPRSNGTDQPTPIPSTGAPQPPATTAPTLSAQPPSPSITSDSNIADPNIGLVWRQKGAGQPFNLAKDESATFTYYIQAHKDDTILRWKFEASYGSGLSTLLQWIPIKNPNPTGLLAPGQAGNGSGIPSSCANAGSSSLPFPDSSTNQQIIAQVAQRWAFELKDGAYSWNNAQYKPVLKVLWDTLSAVECTPFLTDIKSKNSGRMAMYATVPAGDWGDYGLTHPGALSVDITDLINTINNGTPEKATWLFVHEMGHAYNNDRGSNPPYWSEYMNLFQQYNGLSGYGRNNNTENFADVLGYYVARCAKEGGNDNPYASSAAGRTDYYNFAKTKVFGGQEFGPPAPASVSCSSN